MQTESMPAIFKVAVIKVSEKAKWRYARIHRKQRTDWVQQNVIPELDCCRKWVLVRWLDAAG